MAVHLLVQRLAEEVIEIAQDAVEAYEQVGVGTQRIEDTRHLHRNVACPYHGHTLRQLLQLEEAVAIDAVLHTADTKQCGAALCYDGES